MCGLCFHWNVISKGWSSILTAYSEVLNVTVNVGFIWVVKKLCIILQLNHNMVQLFFSNMFIKQSISSLGYKNCTMIYDISAWAIEMNKCHNYVMKHERRCQIRNHALKMYVLKGDLLSLQIDEMVKIDHYVKHFTVGGPWCLWPQKGNMYPYNKICTCFVFVMPSLPCRWFRAKLQ